MASRKGVDETTKKGGESLLLNQPIVIDNGTSSLKAGFAGGSKPKICVDTKLGKAKHLRIMPGGALEQESVDEYYVGQKLNDHRGAFLLYHPMERGQIRDEHGYSDLEPSSSKDSSSSWEQMELLWNYLYSKEMLNAKTEEHPVLLTETPLNPSRNRERMAEIFFETYNVPALFFAPQSVLSLYASGRTTGVVLDVGEGVTHAVPVYEGFALPFSITRSELGGYDVTRQLQLQLKRSGLHLSTTSELDLLKQMKEQVCYISNNPKEDEQQQQQPSSGSEEDMIQYQLPDGETVTLGKERFRAPEVLFQPHLMGSEEKDVVQVLVQSIQKSDIDLRSTFYQQTVLAGGTTLTRGFGNRLLKELRNVAPPHTRIRLSAPPERIYSAWVGGSILGSLSTFSHMWISKQKYEEEGTKALHQSSM